jgi:hypothetical protein
MYYRIEKKKEKRKPSNLIELGRKILKDKTDVYFFYHVFKHIFTGNDVIYDT